MTDDRPAQPGPPGGPPNPPGGETVETRVAVVETRLDDLPTKGDLAEGLAKSDRRLGKRIDALSISVGERIDALGISVGKRIDAVGERIDALGISVGKRIDALQEVMRTQVVTYIRITGIVVSTLLGIFFLVTEWRDEQRQKVVEDVQRVQKAQGDALDRLQQTQARQGETLKAQGETLQAHGEVLDRLQRQVGLLVEHLLGGRGAEPGARGQEPGRQEPQGGGPPPPPESESAPKKLAPPPGRGGGGGAE